MKVNLIAALVLGLCSTAILVVMHRLGVLRSPEAGNWALVAGMTCHSLVLIVALVRHRARDGESISYGRLFGAGLFISFLGGVISALGSLLFTSTIDPTHLDWVRAQTAEQLRAQADLPPTQLEAQIASLPELITPGFYAVQALRALLVVGFVLSLVIAALIRLRGIQLEKAAKA